MSHYKALYKSTVTYLLTHMAELAAMSYKPSAD